jgi:4-diphosphocytidyl-2-C-methyl-D-erythritol kinase
VLINSYAKINLFLDVLRKREDGYHEISTLFTTVDLCDQLRFVLTKKPHIQFLSNIDELSSESNLVYVITKRIFEDFRITCGVSIYLNKCIPIAAGLGGGSSNAAVTIMCLNKLLALNMSDKYMHSVAAEYGSDINFFLIGGFALGKSRGEVIEPLSDVIYEDLLLVNPGLRIKSSEAYRLIDLEERNHTMNLWFNKLEHGIRKKYQEIDKTIVSLKEFGAGHAIMSGSGATCIGLFPDKISQQKALRFFRKQNMWSRVVRIIGRNEYQQCIRS